MTVSSVANRIGSTGRPWLRAAYSRVRSNQWPIMGSPSSNARPDCTPGQSRTLSTDPLHEVLLDSVRQDVCEALDLSPLFLGDDGHVVAALEDVSLPAGQAVDLAGELGLHIAHEAGDLLSVFDDSKDVEVGRQGGDGTEGEVVVSLASSEDAEGKVVERRAGAEEETSLDGAGGDENEGSRGGEVAKSSGHTSKKRKEEDGAWIEFLQEYPDYWTQGKTFEDLKDHLDLVGELGLMSRMKSEVCWRP